MRRLLLITLSLGLLAGPPAWAATPAAWSVADLENEVMCTVCHLPLNESQSAFADGVRLQIQQKHDLGWSKQRTLDWLVQQYGEEVLAAPPKHGFGLLAWVVPGVVLVGGAVIAAVLAMSWSRGRRPPPPPPGVSDDPAMDARIDADLERDE
ncbi:MAG: cytochrome c-type biosis protein CcmH [Gaiellales bacterium]|nr:cytochrome c-type biosis protein CcmH [Gaiellales bacterium]